MENQTRKNRTELRGKRLSLNFIIGSSLISFFAVVALFSLFYTPYPVTQMSPQNLLAPPSLHHWMGTDNFGRDILSRLMKGTQTIFFVGSLSVAIGVVIGFLIGAFAGYLGGWVDQLLMRLMDSIIAFPGLLFALIFVALFGVGILNTAIALGVLSIPLYAKVVRSGYLESKSRLYVDMARMMGLSHARVIFFHILPNIFTPLLVTATLGFSTAILSEAALSYLGLGVQPPHPSWGRMLSESQSYLLQAPYFTLFPGIFITAIVLGFNLLSDGIRDLVNLRREG